MPSATHLPAETGHPAADSAVLPPHHDRTGGAFSPVCSGLSNDYLNHYSEVLMLIEMAAGDPVIAADLADWQPVDYRSYFGASDLRRAADALAAYDALPDESRLAFEKLVAAMDALASMAVFALQPPTDPATAPVIVDATAPALRSLIARAGAFLNSGGQMLPPDGEAGEAQLAIDRVLERAAQRADPEIG
jgi:hypothetical protein